MLAKYHMKGTRKERKSEYGTFHLRCWLLYKQLYNTKFDQWITDQNVGKTRAIFKRMLKTYNMDQIYTLIFCHFEWYGMSGEDRHTYSRLFDGGFSINMLALNASKYASYCEANLTKEVWNDRDRLKKVLEGWAIKLSNETF